MKVDKRTLISIKRKDDKRNDYGESSLKYIDFKSNISASKEQLLGNEYFSAEKINSKVEVKFKTYYIPGVTDEMVIVDNEGTYEILSAINIKSLNRELLIYCKKV